MSFLCIFGIIDTELVKIKFDKVGHTTSCKSVNTNEWELNTV